MHPRGRRRARPRLRLGPGPQRTGRRATAAAGPDAPLQIRGRTGSGDVARRPGRGPADPADAAAVRGPLDRPRPLHRLRATSARSRSVSGPRRAARRRSPRSPTSTSSSAKPARPSRRSSAASSAATRARVDAGLGERPRHPQHPGGAVGLQVDPGHQLAVEQEREHVVAVHPLAAPGRRSRCGSGSRRAARCGRAPRSAGRTGTAARGRSTRRGIRAPGMPVGRLPPADAPRPAPARRPSTSSATACRLRAGASR